MPFFRRALRNRLIASRVQGPVAFYGQVVDANARDNPERAIGSYTHAHWLEFGDYQMSYLLGHGLKSSHRVLEVGCGNLRLGWRLIAFLEEGHYVGLDISPSILEDAKRVIGEHHLQEKRPYLYLMRDANYGFLPTDYFDVVHAHSVFSHMPLDVIDATIHAVAKVMRPGAFFDFTFFETEGSTGTFLNEDYFYRMPVIMAAVERHGLVGERLSDWEHEQTKIRAVKPVS